MKLNVHSFIHSVFCLTTGPKPPPKRCLHIVRCRASSFKWEYPLLSLRSSSTFLRLLPRLLATSISPFIFPSITCFRRQFLRKMWPIQLAFLFLISCRINILRIYCAPTWVCLQDYTAKQVNKTKCILLFTGYCYAISVVALTLTIWRLTATIWVVPHRWPADSAFYIFIQQIYVLNILNMLHNLRLFLFIIPFIS